MHQIIQECPVCGEALAVTKLHCRNCDTSIEGQFAFGRFHGLSSEQIRFAEIFIRCEGKINRVGEELNISYPTVRSRLHDLIRAMGYEVKEDEQPPPIKKAINRQVILADLAEGKITADEATQKLAGE